MLDIFMLAMLTGKERTRREFEDLLEFSRMGFTRHVDAYDGLSGRQHLKNSMNPTNAVIHT